MWPLPTDACIEILQDVLKEEYPPSLEDSWRGAGVVQSVKCPTSDQVMISQFVSSSPVSDSVLTALSLEPASDSVSPSLSAPPPIKRSLSLSLSLSLSKVNKH